MTDELETTPPKMYSCSEHHKHVTYQGEGCPVCEARALLNTEMNSKMEYMSQTEWRLAELETNITEILEHVKPKQQ